MARIVTLMGKTMSGDLLPIAWGAGASINGLMIKRDEIRQLEGLVKIKKDEVQLSELITMATDTAGGEFKGRLRFKK